MSSCTPFARLLLALTALAIAFVQAGGEASRYLCLCGGTATVVFTTHCHGPHGAHCPDESLTNTHQHDGCRGDTEQHQAIAGEPKASAGISSKIIVGAPALIARLPVMDWAAKIDPAPALVRAAEVRGSPPHSVVVARTVVLLI